MSDDRFLLIKAWSYRLWTDIEHVLGQLLIAEVSNRIPIIYWPTHCLHNGFIHTNGFELYFEPVSNYTIFHLARPEYTFYPPVWDSDSLLAEDTQKDTWMYRSIGDFICSDANVVVGDVYFGIPEIIPFIKKDNAAYGMSAVNIYRYFFHKYIKIKPDIDMEIKGFYQSWLKNGHPILAVHVRKEEEMMIDERKEIEEEAYWKRNNRKYGVITSKKRKRKYHFLRRGKILQANTQYHAKIRKFIDKFNIPRIFLLTDCDETIKEYKRIYGDLIVHTDCRRLKGSEPISSMENPVVKRRRGIEIIKDTYLAAFCDFFIGNDFSCLSRTVSRLKDWPDGNIELLFRQRKKRKFPINTKMITIRERKIFLFIVEYIKKLITKIKNKLGIGGSDNEN